MRFVSPHAAVASAPPRHEAHSRTNERSGEKSEHSQTATRLAELVSCAVAVIEYSLSPRTPSPDAPPFHHPGHANDVLSALEFLRSAPRELGECCDFSKMYLIGHSAGAHMLASIFLRPPVGTPDLFSLSEDLVKRVKGIILAEGIYDVDLLLRVHPTYRDFVEGAFGVKDTYKAVSPSNSECRTSARHVHWLVVQSPGDTLIKDDQALAMASQLEACCPSGQVHLDFGSVKGDHDELLVTEEFYKVICDFVREVADGRG